MLFALLSSAGLCASSGLRPSVGVGRSATVANLGQTISAAARADASESAEMVHEAVGIVNAIMLDTGNASDHLTEDDKSLLESVIEMLEKSIYGSMDNSHKVDGDAIAAAINAINQCNENIAARFADGGDLSNFYSEVVDHQTNLNMQQERVDQRDIANKSAFSELEEHIRYIQSPPPCEPLPQNPTKASFDLFFSDSQYVNWFEREATDYSPVRAKFEAADASLSEALLFYSLSLARRDVKYCDWKMELTEGCDAFQKCYGREKTRYLDERKPELEKDMNMRIDAYKAGETIVSQIKFLLGKSTDSLPPTNVDTSRYELSFPDAPGPETCSLEPIHLDSWKPAPSCEFPDFRVRRFNSDSEPYEDKLPLEQPLGNKSLTVVASVKFDSDVLEADARMWILSVGQNGKGAQHWTFNPNNAEPSNGVIQFGTWKPRQDTDQGCQIRNVDVQKMAKARVLATTFDQNTGDFCLFVDVDLIDCKKCGFDIRSNDVRVGMKKPSQRGTNMRGRVDEVDVYTKVLAGDEFMAAIHRLAPDIDASIEPPAFTG